MESTLIKFPAASFRRIESPFDDTIARTYMAVVRIKDLPDEFDHWRKINPRDPKLTSGVSNKIRRSLENDPEQFLFRNRGITLLSDKARFDNKTNIVELELSDPNSHGLLDGGHTYGVLREFIVSTAPEELSDLNACVRLEIIEGITDFDEAVEIVHARNTSSQVKTESLEELQKHFEGIKEVLKGRPYANRIAYKEYEIDEVTGEAKDIDIKEVLSYLVCFDIEFFDQEKHPVLAYSRKAAVLDHFKANRERLEKYLPLLPKILELRDEIYLQLPEAYNDAEGKFGGLTGVVQIKSRPKMAKEDLVFTGNASSYRIPSAFIYPVLAAFRNLVRVTDSRAEWKEDPIKFFHSLQKELAITVGAQAKELRNPTKLGKDQATWKLCNNAVRIQVLERAL